MRRFSPSRRYVIWLPDDIKEQADQEVTSFWKPDGMAALQISSYFRIEGVQVKAQERLEARLKRDGLAHARPFSLSVTPPNCDSAAATVVDEERTQWVHIYMT